MNINNINSNVHNMSKQAVAQGEEKKNSRLAIAAGVMGILCLTCVAFPFLFLPAIVCGILALVQISRNKDRLKGREMAATGIVYPIALMVLGLLVFPAFKKVKNTDTFRSQVRCLGSLQQLRLAIQIYSDDYAGQFPTPERWNDLLIEYADSKPDSFVCPLDESGGGASYAMNQYLAGRTKDEMPGNMVLLFEADLGRNGVGRSGDVVFRHEVDGEFRASFLFVGSDVEFVKKDAIGDLRWKVEGDGIP